MTEPSPDPMGIDVNPWLLDLVVVGFTGELRALKLQARSLRLYASEGTFSRIFIIVNDNAFSAFRAYFETEILPEYGAHGERVELVDYRALTGKATRKTGWRSQQALKLLAVRLVAAPQYLLLDSKNHFIRPVNQSNFIGADGRLRTHMYPVITGFEAYFAAACNYFALPHLEAKSIEPRPTVMPTATPFMMASKHVTALLELVEAREATPFFSFFMETRQFTEFYFYYAYLCSVTGAFDQAYSLRSKPNVTFFASAAEDHRKLVDSSKALDSPDIYLLGVHRRIFEVGLAENLAVISKLWRQFGLVSGTAEAKYFQGLDVPVKRKKFIFF